MHGIPLITFTIAGTGLNVLMDMALKNERFDIHKYNNFLVLLRGGLAGLVGTVASSAPVFIGNQIG